VSTHGLNTQRMSAVQKVWSSYVCATILLQHGPTAGTFRYSVVMFIRLRDSLIGGASPDTYLGREWAASNLDWRKV
jgi:hypothetical protein